MKPSQWTTFAIIFLLVAIYFLFWNLSLGVIPLSLIDTNVALVSRASAFLYVIFIGLSIAFYICARFEKKK